MASKSFKQDIGSLNPAMQFIDAPDPKTPHIVTVNAERLEAPEGYKLNPLYIESKTRRLQLLMRPSLYERVKAKADAENKSVNEFVNDVLESVL